MLAKLRYYKLRYYKLKAYLLIFSHLYYYFGLVKVKVLLYDKNSAASQIIYLKEPIDISWHLSLMLVHPLCITVSGNIVGSGNFFKKTINDPFGNDRTINLLIRRGWALYCAIIGFQLLIQETVSIIQEQPFTDALQNRCS